MPAGAEARARYAVIFALGFFAMTAQAILFRAFFSVDEGSEIGLGVFFCSWLLWVGVGAWLGRRIVRGPVDGLSLLYLPAFLLQWVLIQQARDLAGIRPYDLFPLASMIPVSALINAPVSLVTGFLFTRACSWLGAHVSLPPARVYWSEALGGTAGGVLVTAALAGGAAGERVILAAGLALATAVLACRIARGRWFAAALPVAGLAAALVLGLDRTWQQAGLRKTWSALLPVESYRGHFTTPQAQYLFGEYEGQFIVRAWTSVLESVPDTEHASEVAALALSQAPKARRVLVVGGGYSLCAQLLLLPQVEVVTWLNPDPAYPERLMAVLTPDRRIRSERLHRPRREARQFLRGGEERYDLAILQLPDATTLALNRYSTLEFYHLLRERLGRDGVLAVRFSGGANYIGPEAGYAGASVLATVGAVFPYHALRPGDESWLFASAQPGLTESGEEAAARFRNIEGAEAVCPPERLRLQFPADRIAEQIRAYREIMQREDPGDLVNSDARPRGPFYHLLREGLQGGLARRAALLIRPINRLGLPILLAPLALFAVLHWIASRRGVRAPPSPFSTGLLVFTVGGAGMAFSMTLMFMYQAVWGELYLHAGLASALFMTGLFSGARGGEWLLLARGREPRGGLPLLLTLHGLFILAAGNQAARLGPAGFAALFFAGGFFGGLYTPLAAFRLQSAGQDAPSAGAVLEGMDTLGGAASGAIAGVLALPALGLGGGLALAAAWLAVNVSSFGARRAQGATDLADRWARRLGYTAVGVILLAFLVGSYARRVEPPAADDRLTEAARSMLPDRESALRQVLRPGDRALRYLAFSNEQGVVESFLFLADQVAPEVSGYGGPISLAVLVAADGTLKDLRVVQSQETPAYLRLAQKWMRSLIGRNLFEPSAWTNLDGRTGATITCLAMADILQQSGSAFTQAVLHRGGAGAEKHRIMPMEKAAGWFALFAVAALALRARPRPWVRRLFLLFVILVLGVRLNMQYSMAHVLGLLAGAWPAAGWTLPFILLVVVPVLVAAFGNLYCGYLCPFGALQELAGEACPAGWKADPDKSAWRFARWIKYLLLFGLAWRFALTGEARYAAVDPLNTVFRFTADRMMLGFAASVIVASFFFRRFWCRALCPAGAFLSLLNGLKLTFRWLPGIRPGCCDFGVRHVRELDCILCDRCRGRRVLPSRLGAATRNGIYALVLAAFVMGWGPRLWDAAAEPDVVTPAASVARGGGRSPHRAREVDMKRLESMIQRGQLSTREALYYRRLGEPEPTE